MNDTDEDCRVCEFIEDVERTQRPAEVVLMEQMAKPQSFCEQHTPWDFLVALDL